MAAMITAGYMMVLEGGKGLYMGLILVWAVPFALILWYVSEYGWHFKATSNEL